MAQTVKREKPSKNAGRAGGVSSGSLMKMPITASFV